MVIHTPSPASARHSHCIMVNSGRNNTTRRRRNLSSQSHRYYDLNVPLPSSLSKQEQQNLAVTYQTRLHHLGYHGLAFCHTAYNGRLKAEKDDADVALPWKMLLPSPSSLSPSASLKSSSSLSLSSPSVGTKAGDDGGKIQHRPMTSSNNNFSSFGRTNSLNGITIYRRLNIIVEEVSDVSRILLNHNTTGGGEEQKSMNNGNDVKSLLKKYDFVSLQPMNESVLQSICELL